MVKVSGASLFSAKLRRLGGREKDAEIGRALFVGGQLIEDHAKGSIIAGSVSGKNHVPSRPGEPPSADTRRLDGNIETVQIGPRKVEVSSNAPYSDALERGTSKMQARPFMKPAVLAKKDKVIALVGKALDHVIAGGKLG